MLEQWKEILIIGIVGATCIAWVLVCYLDIFKMDFWGDNNE